jgi:hypothetical protein
MPDPQEPEWLEDDCADDLFCGPDGLCIERLPVGAGCSSDEQCASWWCDRGHCVDDGGGDEPIDWCLSPFEEHVAEDAEGQGGA